MEPIAPRPRREDYSARRDRRRRRVAASAMVARIALAPVSGARPPCIAQLPVSSPFPSSGGAPLAGQSNAISFRIQRLADSEHAARSVSEKSTFIVPR